MTIATILLMMLAQDWPQFRGPDGQGHAAATSVPQKWSDTENVKWKTAIDGLGWSSPVVADGKLWMTTATEGNKSLRAVCVDAATGKILHNVEVFHVDNAGPAHKKNSYASPTPILDKDRVYVHFGSNGTAALSGDGRILWKQVMKYNPVHGAGGSPALVGEHLIFSCDGVADPFVVALDRKTGAVKWKTPRDNAMEPKKFAFCTPLAIEVGKATQVVIPGSGAVQSLDPATGKVIWTAKYPGGYSVVPRPVYGHGMVFFSSGFDSPAFFAVKVDGKGDVTETHVAWKLTKGAPLDPSPLLAGDELYMVSDQGLASCVDAQTGKVHWQERIGRAYSASPVLVGDLVYFQSEDGVTTIVKAEKTFTKVAENTLKGRTFASPAPVDGALFLRTDTQLLRIESEAK
ncbi:MAG TPA: PQQ-binding-like beta-propeller repeat protein [Planctomycetota bacterium]|nr:PQQ-binding-like beta-propeller repeat protein [Planctomycetota bacterium]